MKITFELNGHLVTTEARPGTTLLEFLRNDAGLYSVKHGCDHGECGACTVLLNDLAVNACLILIHSVVGKRVETLEALSNHRELHPIQEAFLDAGAAQCGFCTPGMELAVEALKRENKPVTESAVKDALTGNLCRCTGYVKPIQAALKALEGDSP